MTGLLYPWLKGRLNRAGATDEEVSDENTLLGSLASSVLSACGNHGRVT